jgi:hypothetical protein
MNVVAQEYVAEYHPEEEYRVFGNDDFFQDEDRSILMFSSPTRTWLFLGITIESDLLW